MKELDQAAVSYQVVLTKADTIGPVDLAEVRQKTCAGLKIRPAAHPEVLATSAARGDGIAELRAEIAKLTARSM